MEANISSPLESTCATSELDWRTSGNEQDHPVRSTPEWLAEASPVRIGLVLSGGGLRGASHVGVLQQLVEHDIPIDVIVGSSAGAVSAAYYAAVGLTLDDLIQDATNFRGRHVLAHSLNVRLRGPLAGALTKLSGLIPERLAPLESASFDRLHHNVRGSALPVMTWRAAAPAISRLVRIAAFD